MSMTSEMLSVLPCGRGRRGRRAARSVAVAVALSLLASLLVVTGVMAPGEVRPAAADVGSTAPTLQLQPMATASGRNDRRQYVFALAEDQRIWVSEQTAAGGTQWSDWYALGQGTFCQPPVTIVNSQGFIEVYVVGCDMAVWRAVQTGSGQGGWSAWWLAGSCCIASKVVAVLDGAGRINVFGLGTNGAVYTIRQTSAGANSWTGWEGLGGYVTSTPVAGVDIYGHPYVYALGGDKNVYFQGQESTGGPSFGSWLGWYGVGGGPFVGELGLLAGVVGRRADGRFYVAQKVGRVEHTGWQPLGDYTFISDPVNASSMFLGYDIFGLPRYTVATMFALGTDRQVYVNQQCQAGEPCYSYSYWTGWHLAASGTFLTTPTADWSPDFRRLQMVGMGMEHRVYVNGQVNQLDLDSWTGWTIKPGNGIRADCTLSWPAGKVFYPREYYRGCNNELFTWQDNGQIVLYGPDGSVKWTPGVASIAGSLTIQADGNMVLYDGLVQRNIWSSDTSTSAPRLSFGRDGNLVLFNDQATRYPVWWSNNNNCQDYEWSPGKVFVPGEYYVTCHGDMFTMQASDGNVFEVDHLGQIAWATNVAAPGGSMEFRADGNLVVSSSGGAQLWTSDAPAVGGTLRFDQAGNVAVLDQAQEPKWVKLEVNKKRILARVDEYIGELEKAKNSHVITQERYIFLLEQAYSFKDKVNEYNPRQPCTDTADILLALLGLTGTAKGLYDILKETASTAFKRGMAIASLIAAWWGIVKIINKCGEYYIMEHLIETYRDANELPQQIGYVEQLNYSAPQFPWEVVWVDLTVQPVLPEANFTITYEGDPGFYIWEMVDSICCGYQDGGGGGGGGGGGPAGDTYADWEEWAAEEIAA